jgi:membrane fusion protein (multidrug efflux system)
MSVRRLAGLLLSAFLIVGCGNVKQDVKSGAQTPMKKPGVKIMVLKTRPIASKIRVTGTIDSRVRTWVNAPSEGTVLSLDVREGDAVLPGSVIGFVMSTDQQNLLALAQSQYDQLFKSAGNDSAPEVKSAKARLDAAKSLYKSIPVVCPIKGVVITKAVEPGAIVAARQQLVEIADIGQLIVKTAISEQYISSVKTGHKVGVMISRNDSAATGTVSLIYPSIDIRSRTIGVEISMGSLKNLRPGMSAVVEFTIESHPSALAVPYDAVLVRPNGDKIVFTVSGGTAAAYKVTTGIETNSEIELTGGLSEGDSVIVMGQENLKDGAMVKVMNTPQAGKGGMKK